MDPNATPDGQPNPDGQGDSEPQRPEWLPEKFWTPEGPNVENLAKSYGELETMRGTMKDKVREEWEAERLAQRPEAADKYELPQSDMLDTEALAASPIVAFWRNHAFETGLSNEQFQQGITAYAEAEAGRMQQFHDAQMAALGENAKNRVEAVTLWARKTLGEGPQFEALASAVTSAAGVEALEKLMRAGGADPSAFEGQSSGGAEESEDEIRAIMQTPAYFDPKRRDPKVVARVEAFYQRKYGK